MAELLKMPKLGLTMEEGTVARWLKGEGDVICVGEVYLEVENDKATVEIQSERQGMLMKILVAEGKVVPVSTPIAIIGESGEDIQSLLTTVGGLEPSGPASALSDLGAQPDLRPEKESINASPAARRLALQRGLDLASVQGTGPDGRITREDVLQSSQRSQTSSGLPSTRVLKTIPVSGMRKIIGQVTCHSKQSIPHFYVTADLELSQIMRNRDQAKAENSGAPSITTYVAYAACQAIREHPIINARLETDVIVVFETVNLGLVIALDEGMVIANLPDAGAYSLVELHSEIVKTTDKFRNRRFSAEDCEGSTFTISNLGPYGVREFAAIIHPPEAAILALGQCEQRAVVIEGKVEIRWRMSATLSCDHRVVDGAAAGLFLACLNSKLNLPLKP